ncbi:MAG: AMP-binding protein [Planctomycetaceae bacterium]|nr:AMP-binding protein [Planctomycetaceae bacterium]
MTTNPPLAEFHPLSLDSLQNIGYSLTEMAESMPHAIAVACPRKGQPQRVSAGESLAYESITFAELESKSNQIANGLIEMGVQPGMRIALMVPPGIDFVASVFGLFKSGVVTILIDPGMGRKNMIQCLSDAQPEGMLGIPLAHLARSVFFSKFPKCKHNVAIKGFFPGCKSAHRFFSKTDNTSPPWVKLKRSDPAAIIFTTGSTGPPKGVLYRHQIFIEQCEQIANYFRLVPGGTDVSGFPLFALFNIAMGTTTVFPQMDPTRPADVYPPNIIDAVEQFQANQSFGSPALWNTVANYCVKHAKQLPTIERILSAGAPVPPPTLRKIKQIISPSGDTFTPYGATESLPIACNSGSVVLGETADRTERGEGTCVGKRFPKIDWRIIAIDDSPIQDICDTVPLEKGLVGELMVRGPVVSDQYVTRTDANANHKISDGDSFWHRMGDLGYFDEQDRFWFCGRKTHRVQTAQHTMFTIPCEAIINTHPQIYRSALVGIGEAGKQRPVMICEPNPDHWPTSKTTEEQLLAEIKSLAGKFWQTNTINDFLLHRSLPVDIRHNSKIFREQLRGWAKQEIGV